jgi:hypothetical protein
MIKVEAWPPPDDWYEVVVTWERMLQEHNCREVLDWVEQHPGGQYHLHGYQSTEGFAFRFRDPHDANIFVLRWGR